MIIGDCPYDGCDDCHMVPCADECPAFSRETCDTCGRIYWLRHSRMLPEAFTEEQFAAKYRVDEETKVISERKPTDSTAD